MSSYQIFLEHLLAGKYVVEQLWYLNLFKLDLQYLLFCFKLRVYSTQKCGGSSVIEFTLIKAVCERGRKPRIEPGLGWHTSALTNELQEVI
jgi:hypothetical protein